MFPVLYQLMVVCKTAESWILPTVLQTPVSFAQPHSTLPRNSPFDAEKGQGWPDRGKTVGILPWVSQPAFLPGTLG
jgi:hypothetical protein